MDETLEILSFRSTSPGPRLIVLGAVHGNETCGPLAIREAVADLRDGRLALARGEVTFVPVANPKARAQNTREGDRNLNRDLAERTRPQDHEDRIGNLLCRLLRQHDVLLDLHSFTGEGEPFVFLGPADNDGALEPFRHAAAEEAFAARLGPAFAIHGWLDMFERERALRELHGFPALSPSRGVGTTEFMRFAGGYAVTVECGRHEDPAAVPVAREAIDRALAHLRLVEAPAPGPTLRRALEMTDAILCEREGDAVAPDLRTGEPVAAGRTIARRSDGSAVVAAADGALVFPNPRAKPGETLCYVAVPSPRPFDLAGAAP